MDSCPNCGGVVPKKNGKGRPRVYCSYECKEAFHLARKRTENAIRLAGRLCAVCGSLIESSSGKALNCSPACSRTYSNQRRQEERRKVWEASNPSCARCATSIAHRRVGCVFCSEECKQKTHANTWMKNSPHYMRQYLYGLTKDEYEAMLVGQGGRCAICQASEAGGRGGWHVDHCHGTGKIRGLLCHRCNLMLGHAQDDPERLLAALGYLEAHS